MKKMVKIAVCDSNRYVLEQVRSFIEQIPGAGDCDVYQEPEELIRFMECDRRYEIVLLDIEWKGTSVGIEAGKRMEQLYPDTKMIYMAEHPTDYIQQLFLKISNIHGVLLKPVQKSVLQEYIEKYMGLKNEDQKNGLVIRKKGRMKIIHYDEIEYMESIGHLIKVWTHTECHDCYGRLEEFVKCLPEYFIQCHKSYLVNMKAIGEIDGNQIVLGKEIIIPISKSRYRDTKTRYCSYMNSRIAGV